MMKQQYVIRTTYADTNDVVTVHVESEDKLVSELQKVFEIDDIEVTQDEWSELLNKGFLGYGYDLYEIIKLNGDIKE